MGLATVRGDGNVTTGIRQKLHRRYATKCRARLKGFNFNFHLQLSTRRISCAINLRPN